MGPMNRTMLPPNGPPNMAGHVPGNQQQAHSPNYPQQLGRPSSRPSTPGQGVITNPSPHMANRLPPGGAPPINEINGELMRIPNTLLPKLKQELMIPQDKDFGNMTPEEKVFSRILRFFCFFIVLFSTAFSHTTAESIVTSPRPGQVLLNKHLIPLALPRRL